ncbi:hypothetical protein B0T24DRAFT_530349 [Lasiosphaeria ovina]|uniref:PSP1 C-terminal domain-containing protein n=1 Tax=Lasiosphaeria ovina TaxID=92902 RepID=A0AAE0N595_9PEZI|nr:hypothetical protein B0T24DRAFT_530349 [Lasiosphaeria ovina]
MSSGNVKPGAQSKPSQGNFAAVAPSSQAILLDKLNARRSTPDSEALASSDDEADPHRQETLPASVQPPKPVRRASWLNDTSQPPLPRPRKGSFASSSMSPTTSHPSTPSAESGAGAWGAHPASSAVLGRGHTGPASFPWGTGIWNSERKEPPSRLAEVLPSPTSTIPPGSSGNSFFGGEGGLTQTSPAPREGPNSQIPFAIPLHPTPKTYRSQSYSVGQLEPETTATSMGPSTVIGARGRPIPHSGLQHRPSRPSMLSEMANDGTMLGKVNEDDDDDSVGSLQGSQHQSAEAAKTIEMLTRENAMLRQQQYQNARLRPRASTAAAYGLGNGYLQEAVPEESDYAIDEHDEANDGSDLAAKRNLARRMSEYGAGPFRSPFLVENRKLENVKKGFWQSSLGFGGSGDLPQSRRHSFADVPTRQGSISSIGESGVSHEPGSQDGAHSQEFPGAYPDSHGYPVSSQVSAYFNGGANLAGPQQPLGQPGYSSQYPSPYATLHNSYSNRPTSPHRSMYGMSQPRHNQSLYVVLFKCARADVFYIQEGTGLNVKPGDLVIVEADRGTDLGTVAKSNIDWQTAKDYKEHYAEEHYRWLIMYSQNAAAAQEGSGGGVATTSNGLQASAVGGMGPPSQHHMQEPASGELKPKLIKRLAQSHEIHALRDKEGNEAKAKRVCMQKVKEHGLNMEILDAEFQMDWKKLTFYYFADSYINFNSLVTDLFKIYKTRIWMSAINPASFASPALGLQAPSGIGPGAVGVGRGSGTAERRQNTQPEPQAAYSGSAQPSRGAPSAFPVAYGSDRAVVPGTPGYPVGNYPYNHYSAFGNTARPGALPFAPGMMQNPDSYTGSFPSGGDYAARIGRFPTPQSAAGAQHDQAVPALGQQNDWVGAFHGLSLNSR